MKSYKGLIKVAEEELIEKLAELVNELVEELAELEHEQWIEWSKDIAKEEDLSEDRIKRWEEECWKPYKELSDKMKEFDREWAKKVLKIIRKGQEGPG